MDERGERHPFLQAPGRPLIIAHRGFVSSDDESRGIFENTNEAFASALKAGADILETDTQVTSDGESVLFHDSTLQRFTGEQLKVADLSRKELEVRLRDRGGLLTVREALERFPKARFNIDVKSSAGAEIVARSVTGAGERVLLTSFSDETRLRAMNVARETTPVGSLIPATSAGRQIISQIVKALMWPWPLKSQSRIARLFRSIDAIQVPERHGRLRIVTPKLVNAAHAAGVHVHVWTINEPPRMKRLAELNIDGIVTDRTDLARKVLSVE